MSILSFLKKSGMSALGASVIAIGIGGAVSTAQAETIVSPNAQATIQGNADNGLPFNIDLFGLSSERYQQVYSASDFSSLSEPELITKILFRPSVTAGNAFSSTLPNLQIDLSTVSTAPAGLSTTFANNVGSDDTIVFSGPLSLSSAFTGPVDGPKDFDIVINLQNPFLYNPAAGNLLLDVRNFGGGSTTQFEAEFPSGNSESRLYTYMGGNVNSPTGSTDKLGLVTEWVTTPAQSVPEPGNSAALAILGLGSLLLKKKLST